MQDWAERGEEKSTIIVRILVLIRNVLHVPADTDFENRPDNDANLHDQVCGNCYLRHEKSENYLTMYLFFRFCGHYTKVACLI